MNFPIPSREFIGSDISKGGREGEVGEKDILNQQGDLLIYNKWQVSPLQVQNKSSREQGAFEVLMIKTHVVLS